MITQNLTHVIEDPLDDKPRGEILLAATYASLDFGNGGLHLACDMS